MIVPCVSGIKYFLLFQLMHTYKIVEILKRLKLWHLLRHVSVHARTIIREQSWV